MVNKKLVLQFALAISIICFWIYKANPAKVIITLSNINFLWLLVTLILFVSITLLIPFGMKLFFNPISNVKLTRWFKYYIYTVSASQVLPGKIGDFILVYFLKKEGAKTGASAALIILDKMIVLLVALLLAAIGIKLWIIESTVYWGIMAAVVILMAGLFVISPFGITLIKKVMGKYSSKFPGFSLTIKQMVLQHSPRMALNFVVIAFRFFVIALYYYSILRALGISAPILLMVPLFAITTIASLVPLTPNGLGVRESVGLLLFNKIGVGSDIAISLYLIDISLNYLLAALGLYFFMRNKELLKLSEEKKDVS